MPSGKQRNPRGSVNGILSTKQVSSDANTLAQEQEIDRLVYHLYGLTYDEVLIIDPTPPFTREEYEQEEQEDNGVYE